MFWGLIMEPQRRYSQTVKRAFHISMAALDEPTSGENPTQVICTFDDRNYLLCTLVKGQTPQVALDLNYEVGDKISFATNGKAHVHLTGYLLEDQIALEDDEEEEDEEGIEEEEAVTEATGKSKKRLKSDPTSPPKKKFKTLELLEAVDSNDEDDSDDSDVNTTDLVEDDMDTTAFDDIDSDDDKEGEEEEEDDDSGEEEEQDDEAIEGEDSDESSSLSEDEEVEVPKKVLENGVTTKKGKKQKAAQQQTPVKSQVQQQLQQQQQQKSQKKKDKMEKTPAKGDKTPKIKAEQTPAKGEKTPAKGDKTPGKSPVKQETGSPQKRTIEGGVMIEEVKLGNGAVAKPGKFVKVYYEGRFKNNNKMFDSTTKGAGFEFRLGRQEVIKGWDVGVSGMKVGGKRRIICPPNMAYGQKGSPPTIPPNSTLVFDVELKNVK